MGWVVFGGIVYAVWRLRPQNLLRDLLELEWLSNLQHQRNSRPVSAENLEAQWYRATIATSALTFAAACLLLYSVGVAFYAAVVIATVLTALSAVVRYRCTRLLRTVVRPMYLTLCGIQNARWDTHSPAQKWVRVHARKGLITGITVLLPKDWNASKLGIASMTAIVQARVPGEWVVKEELDRFRVTYNRKEKPVNVNVVVDSFPVSNADALTESTARNATVKPATDDEYDSVELVKTDGFW